MSGEPAARPAWVVPAVVGILVLSGLGIIWAITRGGDRAFLSARGGARWILYPHTPRTGIRPAVELDARFARTVILPEEPANASLAVRAFRRFELSVNGDPVAVPVEQEGWKAVRSIPLDGRLRAGENTIEVTVFNDRGPPAFWATLETPDRSTHTDRSWKVSLAGAAWRPARLARDRLDPAAIDPEVCLHRPIVATGARWKSLALIFALSAFLVTVVVASTKMLLRRCAVDPERLNARGPMLLAGILAILWVVLFLNDAPSLWAGDGYDAEGHLEYVRYLMTQKRLPWPDSGWSTFHPPLYYALSALVLGAAGATPFETDASFLLRVQSALLGVVYLGFLFGGLRRVFPGRGAAQAAGLLIAGFLPVHLYMFQFIGNDGLAAVFVCGSVYLALRILDRSTPGVGIHAGLGALLGAAMLAKFSSLIAVVTILAVLAGRLLWERRPGAGWVYGLLVSAGTCLLVCGWHFARVAWRFGNPFVGNWDPAVLPAWWQDPGYLTSAFYLRFGQSLTEPLFSSFNSLADGLYTTWWGDSLIAGRSRVWFAPPWDYELMAAGYLLSLFPLVLIALGAVSLLRRFSRDPQGRELLLLALAGMTAFALIVWPARIPIYSVVKGIFATPAVLPLCAFASAGWIALGRRRPIVGGFLLVLLCAWGMTSYAAFWIPRGSVDARARLGWLYAGQTGRGDLARENLEAALVADPSHAVARLGEAKLLAHQGRRADAVAELRALVADRPEHRRARLKLAEALVSLGRGEEARREYEEVLRAAPGDAVAHLELGKLLQSGGEVEQAIGHYREALATVPESLEVHRLLASALEEADRAGEADRHRALASRLERGR